jgi:hypothetical protein
MPSISRACPNYIATYRAAHPSAALITLNDGRLPRVATHRTTRGIRWVSPVTPSNAYGRHRTW